MNFQSLASQAHSAGMSALQGATPTPMIVAGGGERYFVSEGACGFAWVELPGNCAFGRWAKKVGLARPAYPKGLNIWVSEGGQSIDRKEAYARAYAAVLQDAGVPAFAGSRLD